MSSRTALTAAVGLVVVAGLGTLAWLVLSGGADDPAAPDPGGPGDGPAGVRPAADDSTGGSRGEVEKDPKPAPPPAPGTPWVPVDGFTEGLGAVDWKAVGQTVKELVPLLAEVAGAASADSDVPDAVVSRSEELRRALDDSAMAVQPELPNAYRAPPVGSPAFAANAAAAGLHARGRGLSTEQLAALAELAARAMEAEVAAARGSEESNDLLIRRALREFERRKPFFDGLDALLTARQRNLLHGEIARGRVRLDPFSAATTWEPLGVMEPVIVPDDTTIGNMAFDRISAGIGFDRERADVCRQVLARRVALLGPDLLPRPGNWLDAHGFLHGERVAGWAVWCEESFLEMIRQSVGRMPPRMPHGVLRGPVVFILDPGVE